MPTNNPRITFTVSDEMMKRIENYRYDNRMKNQTRAILDLIEKGFETIHKSDYTEPISMLSTEEKDIISLYHNTIPAIQPLVIHLMESNQIAVKGKHA